MLYEKNANPQKVISSEIRNSAFKKQVVAGIKFSLSLGRTFVWRYFVTDGEPHAMQDKQLPLLPRV